MCRQELFQNSLKPHRILDFRKMPCALALNEPGVRSDRRPSCLQVLTSPMARHPRTRPPHTSCQLLHVLLTRRVWNGIFAVGDRRAKRDLRAISLFRDQSRRRMFVREVEIQARGQRVAQIRRPDAALDANPQLTFAASCGTLPASSIALIMRTQRPHLAVQQSEA
jgi:hypothetical protein